jgi:uncharacterized protein YndB with AHSA1/START domain
MTTLTLELERVFAVAPPVLWLAFANPVQLERWWGPEGVRTTALDWSPRAGGAYRLAMAPALDEPFELSGEFRAAEEPSRLTFTFVWEPPDTDDVETVADLVFRDLGEATQLQLTQGTFKTEARLEVHRHGWGDSLDRLSRVTG